MNTFRPKVEELNQLNEFVDKRDDLSIDYKTNWGIMCDKPGHRIYIFNEGSGWMYSIESDSIQHPEESEEYETFNELLENISF